MLRRYYTIFRFQMEHFITENTFEQYDEQIPAFSLQYRHCTLQPKDETYIYQIGINIRKRKIKKNLFQSK